MTSNMPKQLWLHLVIAALVALPIVSLMGNAAKADFTPPPDSGQPGDNGSAGSSY